MVYIVPTVTVSKEGETGGRVGKRPVPGSRSPSGFPPHDMLSTPVLRHQLIRHCLAAQ